MAASSRDSINQRISLTGDDDVRRRLEQIAATGEQSFNRVGSSAGQLRFAMQNLSFQVNDLVTGFASGQAPMRIFAQQGGQIVEAFQQGGGFGNVLSAAATKLKEFLTPTRALAGLGAAAAAGVGLLALRAQDAESAMRQFGVTLQAIKPPPFAKGNDALKGLGIDPQKLEESARKLRDAGLSLGDAQKEILSAIQNGVDPRFVEGVIRFGKDLDAAFGEGARSGEAFKKAIEGGKDTLRAFGIAIGQINPNVTELQDGLRDIPSLLRKIMEAPNIKGAAQNVLSPLAKDARDINVEFQQLLDRITIFGKEGIVNFANTVEAAIGLVKSLFETLSGGNFSGLSRGIAAAFEPLKTLGTGLIEGNLEIWKRFFTSLAGEARAAFRAGMAALSSDDPLGISALASASVENVKSVFATVGQLATEALTSAANDAITTIPQLFADLGQAIIDAFVNVFSSADPYAPLEEKAQSAADNIRGVLQSVLDFANNVGNTIAQALSSAAGAGAIPGFAAGGLIRGPGTGTSDSVPLWASTGEFIVNAAATRANLPLLQAINALSQPIVPRSRGFAMGGLVTAGAAVAAGPGSVVNLTIGAAGPFPLRGDREIVDAVGREARKAQLLSGGKKPSWKT